MPFTKGHRKLGGRKKGTPNKINKHFRERISEILDDKWELMVQDLNKLSPSERIHVMVKLMDFIIPKLNRIDINSGPKIDYLLEMSETERVRRIEELKERIIENDR